MDWAARDCFQPRAHPQCGGGQRVDSAEGKAHATKSTALQERSKTRFRQRSKTRFVWKGYAPGGENSSRQHQRSESEAQVCCGLQFYEGQAARLPRLARELTIQEEIKPPGDEPNFLTSTQSEIKCLELHGSGKLFFFKAHVGKTTPPTASLFQNTDSLRILTPDRWGTRNLGRWRVGRRSPQKPERGQRVGSI